MRSIKELLEEMLKNKELFDSGLCTWAYVTHVYGKISRNEYLLLFSYIKEHRPYKYSSFDAWMHSNRGYYWSKGNIKPRIKWIEKHIKKNK